MNISKQVHTLTYLSTYLLTSWSRVLLEKLTIFQQVKKFPAFYGTRKFITAFKSARHLSILRQIDPVHTHTSHFIKNHLNIILPSSLVLRSVLFLSSFSPKTLYTPLIPTCPAHFILLDFINRTISGEE